jgi:carbamoyltransferase
MYILGISAFYHDAAAALIEDGHILAAAQEERFTRKKHDASFPIHALKYCLTHAGIRVDDLQAVVFYDKPLLKLERLLETYYAAAPQGIASFLQAMPVWIKEKMFVKNLIRQELKKCGEFDAGKVKLLFTEHHLSHAASAFYPSGFGQAALLTMDAVGEWATASIGLGNNESITIFKELHFPHSPGLLYSAFTYYLGFRVNSGEYKLMGLAPYGDRQSGQFRRMISLIRSQLIDLKEDGSLWLNQDFFSYTTGFRMLPEEKWEKLFGFPKRQPEDPVELHHCNLALAIQEITEEIVIRMAHECKRLTGSDHLCMAGGVALNCVANGKLQKAGLFRNLFIQPAAGDAGGAVGAALAAFHLFFEQKRIYNQGADLMQGTFLGPEFSDAKIKQMATQYQAVYEYLDDFDALVGRVARLLASGLVVGWMQGRMEFGPRALGNRSILADARHPRMHQRINERIKFRESFRPFAPSVLAEQATDYFDLPAPSPYMLLVHSVKKERQIELPDNFSSLSVTEKINYPKSDLPSVTHADYSARIHTVEQTVNLRFYQLLQAFQRETGCAVLLNTSLNVRGEPIACTPEDAYHCLIRTDMDYLVIGNFLFDKKQQPSLPLSHIRKNIFEAD